MTKFTEKLKELLIENVMSQNKLALTLNVRQQTVNGWCRGIREPDFEMLLKICLALNTEPNYILGYDEIR